MARSGRKGGMIGSKVTLPSERHFTNTAEISQRDKQTHQMPPTHFVQVGPEDQPGKSMATIDQGYENKTTNGNKFSGFGG